MQLLHTILIMLLVVGATRLTAQFLPLPLPLVQIAAGALLALPAFGLHVRLDPELFMLLFIPPLLFADGWRMPKREFWRLRTPILTLAFGLVLFTVLGAGAFIHLLLPDLPWAAAFALAAVLSPTDAVAVAAISQGRLPRSLEHILQGEALMNDASGLVAFRFAVAATLTGYFSLGDSSLDFFIVALGGLALGVLLAVLLGYLRQWMIGRGWDDPATHVVFLFLLPFAAYVVAERLEVSGILSAVAAGMMQSRLDLLPRQTVTRLLNRSVWAMLDYSFNGLVFLLLGLQLPDIVRAALESGGGDPWQMARLLGYVLAVFGVLLALRFAWMYGYWWLSARVRRWRGRPSTFAGQSHGRLTALLSLAGVRGAVTLAGVLSLPLALADGSPFLLREVLIFIAAGVILLSLLVASLGLPWLVRGMPQDDEAPREQERRRLRELTVEAAIRRLEAEPQGAEDNAEATALATETKARVMAEYRSQLCGDDDAQTQRRRLQQRELERHLRLEALRAQRLELYRLRRQEVPDDDLVSELLHELDVAESMLQRR